MKLTTKKDKRTDLERLIDDQIIILANQAKTLDQVGEIVELLQKREELNKKKGVKVSPDTIAIIAGNLIGIGLILSFEKLNVISSKALGFVLKGRV